MENIFVNEYERRAHSVGISIWHFEWCSKCRYKIFSKFEYCNLMIACIRKAAYLHKIKIVVLSVMPEHVHCEVEITLAMSPAYALQILKGLSSKLFFEKAPKFRLRYPKGHLWSGRVCSIYWFCTKRCYYRICEKSEKASLRKPHTLVWEDVII